MRPWTVAAGTADPHLLQETFCLRSGKARPARQTTARIRRKKKQPSWSAAAQLRKIYIFTAGSVRTHLCLYVAQNRSCMFAGAYEVNVCKTTFWHETECIHTANHPQSSPGVQNISSNTYSGFRVSIAPAHGIEMRGCDRQPRRLPPGHSPPPQTAQRSLSAARQHHLPVLYASCFIPSPPKTINT